MMTSVSIRFQIGGPMTTEFVLLASAVLTAIAFPIEGSWAADPAVFRNQNELIVQFGDLDRWRQEHPQLKATLRLIEAGGEKLLTVDLADRLTPGAIVVDLTGSGVCAGVALDVKDGEGRTIHAQQVRPIPMVTLPAGPPVRAGAWAAIERGSQWLGPAPQIALPDVTRLRAEKLVAAVRSVTASEITYPVIADADLPALASANGVIVSRQSFAPRDASRCSLYFSYRKALFDGGTTRLKGYRKLLVEVPLQQAWLDRQGDDVITLPLDGFAIHTTEERERFGQRWNAPQGYNLLGESSTGLFQGGQTVDTDDQGRIYISNVSDGAGIVRFNPQLGQFEQPPINFHAACRNFLPTDGEWKRSWDAELAHIVCTRGRVYLVFDRHYRTTTPNGKFETCSGVVSLPQEGWDDAETFRRDIRLHAACWPQAQHPLYPDDVVEGKPRRAGPPVATTHGIAFGSWRLDLDEHGNTQRLAVVKHLSDTLAAEGTAVPPTTTVTYHGLPKQRLINVGAAGRRFLKFSYGEFEIARAALALTLPNAPPEHVVDVDGRYRSTFPGAPTGTLTVRFDITAKIKSEPQRFGTLAGSLSGVAQGPNYAVIHVPGEADQAIGVCEYSYYFSKLDFSRRGTERNVFRSYLPLLSGGRKTALPIGVGLGPYHTAWIEHDDALWLYLTGYTGMARLKYAEGGRPLAAFTSEVFHTRLTPQPIDGAPRGGVKDFLYLLPAIDGHVIDIGRGRPGRGGGPYSAALELFHPGRLGASQTAAGMSRCYGLHTPVYRLVLSALGKPTRQELYVASGGIRPEYVAALADPALRPQNQDPKVFAYECPSGGNLRDLYGFSLPPLSKADTASDIAFSPCRQFLVMLQGGGVLHTYSLAQRRFVDGVQLRTDNDEPIRLLSFSRPSATLWTSPNGQIFFVAALQGEKSRSVDYFEVTVSREGRLDVAPHLAVSWSGAGRVQDFDDIVHCFLPDLTKHDGSYDLVLGGSQENGGQTTVRVIDDFIPPRR
jgi:hypothetical protein